MKTGLELIKLEFYWQPVPCSGGGNRKRPLAEFSSPPPVQQPTYIIIIIITRICLQNKAPQYLMDYCTRSSDVSSRQNHRSANRHPSMVPQHRRNTLGRRTFSVAGPMEWNSLPHSLRDPARSTDGFRSALKTHLMAEQKDV